MISAARAITKVARARGERAPKPANVNATALLRPAVFVPVHGCYEVLRLLFWSSPSASLNSSSVFRLVGCCSAGWLR